jgi:two-component system chemotaxis response regulator CheY
MRILIVDDHATMRRIIRMQLATLGYRDIDEAADGEEAFAKLRAGHFALVIADWNMEPVTGFDLLRLVRAEETLRALPFIMITAEAKSENFEAAKEAGVDGYVAKPFDVATLRQRIETALATRRPARREREMVFAGAY